MKITAAQAKTLRTLIARGGEMNSYAGQPGFYCNSVRPLKLAGLVDNVDCACAWGDPCTREHLVLPGTLGHTYYGRIRINDAGRAALAAYDASKES